MEQHLGRKLLSSEHVHHIDHDGLNNRIENLVVMTAREHQRHHLMGTRKWPVDEGAKLRAQGWTLEQIADHYGVSPQSVLKAFRVRGISTRNERNSQKPRWDVDEAVRLRDEGSTWAEIGRRMGVTGTAIQIVFKRRGLWPKQSASLEIEEYVP